MYVCVYVCMYVCMYICVCVAVVYSFYCLSFQCLVYLASERSERDTLRGNTI